MEFPDVSLVRNFDESIEFNVLIYILIFLILSAHKISFILIDIKKEMSALEFLNLLENQLPPSLCL